VKRATILLCVLTLMITSARGEPQVSSTNPRLLLDVVTSTSPAAANTAQPQVSSLGDRVVLSWVERSGEIAIRPREDQLTSTAR
jgi:hypothetical protein